MASEGLKAHAKGRRDLMMIDPRDIKCEDGLNPRDFGAADNSEHVAFLKSSIRRDGVKVPLTVRLKGDEVWLVDGESRLRAVLELVAEGESLLVPCQAEERHTSESQRVIDLVTRNTGKRFTPLELGHICKRLIDYGWAQQKIAEDLGCSPGYVSHCLSLLTMPEAVKDMVRAGEVSAATALGVIRQDGEEAGAELLKEARADVVAEARADVVAEAQPEIEFKPAPEPKVKKVTEKRLAATRQKKAGVTASQKPLKAAPQSGPRYDEAMFIQINKFLGKCLDGSYEDDDNDVPDKLASAAKDLAESIKMFRRGFQSEAAG